MFIKVSNYICTKLTEFTKILQIYRKYISKQEKNFKIIGHQAFFFRIPVFIHETSHLKKS